MVQWFRVVQWFNKSMLVPSPMDMSDSFAQTLLIIDSLEANLQLD